MQEEEKTSSWACGHTGEEIKGPFAEICCQHCDPESGCCSKPLYVSDINETSGSHTAGAGSGGGTVYKHFDRSARGVDSNPYGPPEGVHQTKHTEKAMPPVGREKNHEPNKVSTYDKYYKKADTKKPTGPEPIEAEHQASGPEVVEITFNPGEGCEDYQIEYKPLPELEPLPSGPGEKSRETYQFQVQGVSDINPETQINLGIESMDAEIRIEPPPQLSPPEPLEPEPLGPGSLVPPFPGLAPPGLSPQKPYEDPMNPFGNPADPFTNPLDPYSDPDPFGPTGF